MAAPPSPRLPSPPPFTEVQIEGPQMILADPTASSTASKISPPPAIALANTLAGPATKPISTTTRRIRPGSRSRDINTGLSPIALSELDSAFQLQEHLASLLTATTTITSPGDSTPHTVPISKESAKTLASPPPGIDPQLWCYELTRRLTRDLNYLLVALLQDNCTNKTCPQMRASEWQYLCAVHDSPQSCCAIDYSCHTLDYAATILTSSRYFPSRLSLTAQGGKHLSSIFRRLYRIFAHAWFQHQPVFWQVEGEWGLYLFFKTVSEQYNLIPEDNLTIPPAAEGIPDGDIDEFSRGTLSGPGNKESTVAQGDYSGKDKKEGQHDEGEEDYGSDDSDSDEHSGSGSSSDDDEGDGGGGDAFDLELPIENINETKGEVKGEGDPEAGGERHVNGELGATEGAMEESDVTKKEDEVHDSSEEDGEEIPLLMEQELPLHPTRSPSPPQPLATPPPSLSPPPTEEAPCVKEDEERSHQENTAVESDTHPTLETSNTEDSTIIEDCCRIGEETEPEDTQTPECVECDGAPQAEPTPPTE